MSSKLHELRTRGADVYGPFPCRARPDFTCGRPWALCEVLGSLGLWLLVVLVIWLLMAMEPYLPAQAAGQLERGWTGGEGVPAQVVPEDLELYRGTSW
jgi:hypothetical protein